MPLSLTCTCGAKLEIDDTFAGKMITCPDCRKELSTAPQAIWASHTSGFALASLVLALAGSLTFVFPIIAVGLGVIALWHIKFYPEDVGGKRIAWAGILVGGLFALLSVGSYLSPDVFTLDGIFREIEWAPKLNYKLKGDFRIVKEVEEGCTISITRTSLTWGGLAKATRYSPEDDLILVNAWQDAFISCTNSNLDPDNIVTENDMADRAFDRFRTSEVVQLVTSGELKPKAEERKEFRKSVACPPGVKETVEMVVDIPARPPRT